MSAYRPATAGAWSQGAHAPAFTRAELLAAIPQIRRPAHVLMDGGGRLGLGLGGAVSPSGPWPLIATLPALYPEWLGDRSFLEVHGLRFPYVAGAMANGIATTELVLTMARHGMLGFFGAAGLPPERVAAALDTLRDAAGDAAWGSNLIHSPNEADLEQAIVDLYLARGVRRVSASAYMALTPMVVQFAYSGVRQRGDRILRPRHVFAKVSRPEVARRFMSPPPGELLDALVAAGRLSAEEARLARHLPVAEDYIVEADSGGHTDNQTLTALFPIILRLRDTISAERGYTRPIRVGAAGGLGDPAAVAAAFSLGAAFVLTGSVNQSAVESGLHPSGRELLARAGLADVMMAPAADMFELGVKVQVLKRGTMFGVRAAKLYELYSTHEGLEQIRGAERERLEREILQAPVEAVWEQTRAFFARRDPRENARAERDPKHRMALVFRWYLGQSSRWAIRGVPERRMDYQIWCGPAMGAFNDWVRGSFLEPPEARTAGQIALNLLEGAAVVTRAQQLRSYGLPVPPAAFRYAPRPLG